MLLNTLEEIMADLDDSCSRSQFYMLQYEIQRLNGSLMRLLTLYKADKSQLSLNIDFYSVSEFIEDIVLQHEQLLNSRGIDIEVDVPEDLFWGFDRSLVAGVIDNVMNNAFRYTKDRIKLRAGSADGYLVVNISDNGKGYPEGMLFDEKREPRFKERVNFDSGSTGLGLYFSFMVAKMHSKPGREGRISLVNGGDYGGGTFSLFLP